MASDTNVCVFTGRLGDRADLRFTNNNKPVLNWRMAVTTGWGDRESTMWLTCKMWGPRAQSLADHMTKGTRVSVDGRMESREYEKDGTKRIVFELVVANVVLLGSPNRAADSSGGGRQFGKKPSDDGNHGDPGPNDPGPPDDFGNGNGEGSIDDNIPF